MMMGRLNDVARASGMKPAGASGGGTSASALASPAPAPAPAAAASVAVVATVIGLVSAAELNDCDAEVLSWAEAKGRYQCRVHKPDGAKNSVAFCDAIFRLEKPDPLRRQVSEFSSFLSRTCLLRRFFFAGSCASVAIKPGNLRLLPGTKVTVCGVKGVSDI
jgi:hypothetical protein